MNYIYDILLNFNKNNYDFYDWEVDDDISHVRKIPLFKLNTKDLLNLNNYVVEVKQPFLESIKNKTEIFSNRNIKKIEYACLCSDSKYVVAINFNEKGVCISKSKLLIDEELEVLEVVERIDVTKLDYEILENENKNSFKTRNETKMHNYLLKEIRKLEKQQNIEKLKYVYFDCFDKNEDAKEIIVKKLEMSLTDNWEKVSTKMYDFFKLTSVMNE